MNTAYVAKNEKYERKTRHFKDKIFLLYFKDIQNIHRGELAETFSDWSKVDLKGDVDSFKKAVFPNLLHPQFALSDRQFVAMQRIYKDKTANQILDALRMLPQENQDEEEYYLNNVLQVKFSDMVFSPTGEVLVVRAIWKKLQASSMLSVSSCCVAKNSRLLIYIGITIIPTSTAANGIEATTQKNLRMELGYANIRQVDLVKAT